MTDFLDRLTDQFVVAERSLTLAAAPPPRRRARRWRTRKTAMLALATFAVAVPALAATQPWQPILGRPALHDTPTGISASAPPADQLALLGVLRRPQDAQDRSPAVQAMLSSVGIEFQGVRTDTVRLLTSASGHSAVLVSAERIVDPGTNTVETNNPLCLVTGQSGTCSETQGLVDGHFLGLDGDYIYGLVPDGVAKVVLRYPDGQTLSTSVQDNFFWINGTPTTTRTIPNRPPLSMAQAPTAVQWLDANGTVVGPPLQK